MREITITPIEIEKLASQALSVPTDIDLGASPNGGRYYLKLGDGIDGAVDSCDLERFVRNALREWFQQRRTEIRTSLAEWIQTECRATREVAEYEKHSVLDRAGVST